MNQISAERYDAVVVGAGISGLLSALVLTKEGKRVAVLEKTDFVGGNCRSYDVGGFQVDTGPHAITWLNKGPLVELMDGYFDVVPKFKDHGNYYVRSFGKMLKFPYTLQALARFTIFSNRDRLILAKALIDATKSHTTKEKELEKSVYDYIIGYDPSPKALEFIDLVSYFLSGSSMKETPVWRILSGGGTTDELSTGIKKKISGVFGIVMNTHESHQGYPIGGIKSITNCVLASMPKSRATIKTNEEVVSIKKGKKAFLTKTKKRAYESDIVVYCAEIKKMPNMLENPLTPEYVSSLSTLRQSTRAMTLWLGLKRKIPAFDYIGSEVYFEGETPYWAMPVSNYDPRLAPKGMQLVGFGSRMIDGETAEDHKKTLIRTIKQAIPEIENEIVMEHVQITIPDKASITVGSKFPGPKTPIDGLYAAGTDIDPRSMGITRAAYSVVEMIKAMKDDGVI